MNDSIQPIRYNPQIEQIKPKRDSTKKKDSSKEEKEIPGHVKKKNKDDLDQENKENGIETSEDSQKDNDSDDSSGTILDVEV